MGGEIDLTRVLCRLADIGAGGFEFRIGRGDWPLRGLLVKSGADVYAYVNRCPHKSFPLNYFPDKFMSPDGGMIHCHAHGALFEKETGYCVLGPCAGRSLIAIPVVVKGDYVVLANEADPDALAALHA
jgi:naringenin degradation protein FdeD